MVCLVLLKIFLFIDGPYKFFLDWINHKKWKTEKEIIFDEETKNAELPNFESRFGNNIKVKRSEFKTARKNSIKT